MDTGDLLFARTPTLSPNVQRMSELKANLYMRTYGIMGYDAFTPGELDFSFGVGPVIQMSKQANFPFLAANLMDAKSKKPVFESYTIKEVQGVKVGLLGLISSRNPLGGPPEEKGKYYLADPVETAQKIVPQLRKKTDLIVALAHMELEEEQKLAQAVPDIFFILSGHNPTVQPNPTKSHNSSIFEAGSRGEQMGQVEFYFAGKDMFARYNIINLTIRYADHPQVLGLLNLYKAGLRNLLQMPPQPEPAPESAAAGLQAATPPVALFVGEKACLACHPEQHKSWQGTDHARAYQTLVRENKTSDPGCLQCHTTGYGEAKKDLAADFQNVQCEVCHGPGDGHPEPRKSLPRVSEDVCLRCHNTANSPFFNYNAYLQKVRHKK